MKKLILGFLLSTLLFGFNTPTQKPLKYLPLGDSYTICTGATEKESWPVLLSNTFTKKGIPFQLLANPARNGFSTQQLIEEELPLLNTLKPEVVTVLIGVNDWVRGVDAATFKKNLLTIANTLQQQSVPSNRVVWISIPDFGVTPQGAYYSRGRNISEGITTFNVIIQEVAKQKGSAYVDVFKLSQEMGKDKSLIAKDGLHPSAKEYALWMPLIYEAIKTNLEK